ncbi:soluble guanylate cyclase 88E-like isoform X2 [Ostrea edulis]|uniref:soluble guanylate cyclase 88E-like isoform X2 n=1 Tax=Ostrea edulis TaxID=37623 RepID=UPI0020951A75|nr:soluble guanylate cyclase 88E-like isoform X2 [Ostrea edulis]XP_055996230.1 soluble guanylate cyclase 88E-like isoform X2 [Ostrea edulis]XP_055996231.1 soluble guanylate cyclase 88E-like isoform X2 [Ostrea edulis]XP_055996232.1 soluble guanylate cyclase 88E-like isoform X2 [Ostrea edulis]XP_055996233.1 soluble guanylate cyclase 88E-like isoform X2 [Ostrea edulis]XP_055996234.1 soluble guanylate cyclase 88E-like isoform X2 [Ostrea edulis]XP_055996235.1 soluble guanylate cyclase 88E-like iso
MYGLLLESVEIYLKETYGDDAWEKIRKLARVETMAFSTHKRYSESIIPDLARACSLVLNIEEDDIMDAFGVSFVSFVGQYGYDKILSVLGRNMRDFLNGLDNLHEYLRFSYPKLKPPSFFCTNESTTGLTLHYRSKRKGFVHYVKGQIRQVGKLFYKVEIIIDVVSLEVQESTTHVVFRLHFENNAFKEELVKQQAFASNSLPLNSSVFFNLFPFHIVFTRSFEIRGIGSGIAAVFPSAKGQKLHALFSLTRPLIGFNWDMILQHTNNVFELMSYKSLKRSGCPFEEIAREAFKKSNENDKKENPLSPTDTLSSDGADDQEDSRKVKLLDKESSDEEEGYHIRLKGQMMYMMEWECIIFLATPMLEDPDAMFRAGLYINDLSMHDSSRDLVLAGTQQSAELKLALDQEQQKSKILEESMRKLDAEMKRTDSLLYQMIPKPVADRLRRGEPAITTCQVFDNVTILFSDVVGFTSICSQISPMEVVCMLNAMYTKFDQLSERHGVYKVETIGDAYMVVSGAPEITAYHALNICNMAMDMISSMVELSDPSTGGHMRIRVGIHSGTTVAGVVGIKMPRYCLFGDTVNTASRMETNGEAMKIHISQTTWDHIKDHPFRVEERGSIPIKGKGNLKSYWLLCLDDKDTVTKSVTNTPRKESKTTPSLDARSLYSPISFEDLPRKRSMDASLDVIKQNDRNNSLDALAISKRNGSLDLTSPPFRSVDKQRSYSPQAEIQVNFRKASTDTQNGETSKVKFATGSKKGFEDGKGFLGEEKSSLCQIL